MPAGTSSSAPQGPDQNFPIVVATMPTTAAQRHAAIVVVLLLLVLAAIEAPFAHIALPRLDAFIPVLQTVICVADLITAILLFAQYSVQPRLALLVLASGYIASGSFSFLQTLAFPGAYAPGGLFGDGVNSAAWFFVWWHTTFPAAILVYALTKDKDIAAHGARPRTRVMIAIAIACATALVAGLTWLATAGVGYLPGLYTGGVTQQTLFANKINVFMWLWGSAALVVVFLRSHTILDLWLIVTLFAWMPNFLIAAVVTAARFSVGWYSARMFALIASCTVLAVLLTETTVLYARLANAVTLLRRERANRLMSLDAATAAMAHEIRQPLAAIGAQGAAAINWLRKTPPELDEACASIKAAVDSSERIEKIIASIRALFRKREDRQSLIRMDDVAREVLLLVQQDIQANRISVATDHPDGLPAVYADRIQLQQVILNVVRNAIEAMSYARPSGERRLRVTTKLNGASDVLLSIEDSGPGISAGDRERIFDPFFSTKPAGMGLGLAICQTIVEEHDGQLRLAKTDSSGSIFEIALPGRA